MARREKTPLEERVAAMDKALAMHKARCDADEANLRAKLATITPLAACQEIAAWWRVRGRVYGTDMTEVSVPVPLIRAAVAAVGNARGK